MSRKIEHVRRSFCRHGSCTSTEVAHFVPSCPLSSRGGAPAAACACLRVRVRLWLRLHGGPIAQAAAACRERL